MKTRQILALTLVLLLAAVVPASAAAEPVISNQWIDQSGGGWNSCTNEWVEMTGTVHFVEIVVQNAAGGYTLEFHSNGRWTGVGSDTGAQYLYLSNGNEHETVVSGDLPYIHTDVFRSRNVTPGPGNNEVYWTSYHITVNPDGTVAVEFDNSGWECR